LDTGDTNEKNAKLGQHRREQGHVTYFFKFWKPSKTVSQTIRNSIGPLMYKAMQQPL